MGVFILFGNICNLRAVSAGQQLHTLEQWTAGTAARGAGSSEIGHKDTFQS